MHTAVRTTWVDHLWGPSATVAAVWLFAGLVLFAFLGSRELWTQEGRWAAIVSEMILRDDYLHPYLLGKSYYYKPLLSYWFVVFLSYLTGGLGEWALRLPSAMAGAVAIWSTYRLALVLLSPKAAQVAAWMLVTTVFFVFWARVSSADMLNVMGTVLAVLWYFEHRERQDFPAYAMFFLILAITSLTKGLVGAVVPIIVIIPDLCSNGRWRKHLNPQVLLAGVPALLVYFLPFAASSYYDSGRYATSGLSLVILENFTRYFEAFDHQGPLYTYVFYMPLYLMPWILFFAPAVWYAVRDWKTLNANEKWPLWATLLIFIFFTASGTRRSYYILPLLPFATLVTANWVAKGPLEGLRNRLAAYMTVFSGASLLLWVLLIQPILVHHSAAEEFGRTVRVEAGKVRDWADMPVLMSGGQAKMAFYVNPAIPMTGSGRRELAKLMAADPCRVVVSRKKKEAAIRKVLGDYKVVVQSLRFDKRLFGTDDMGRGIAFIPPREVCQ